MACQKDEADVVFQRLFTAFEDAREDYVVVADTLGVNHSAARRIIATFLKERRMEELPRGGTNNAKVDEETRQCLNEIINANSLIQSTCLYA